MFSYLIQIFKNKKSYLILLLINILSAIGNIFLYKIINKSYGEEELYLFTYYKRLLSFLAPISLMGMGVTLVRNITVNKEQAYSYTIVSLLITLLLPICLLLFYSFNPDSFRFVLFAGENYDSIIYPIIINLTGLGFFSMVISFFRGYSEFIKASILSLIFVTLVPYILIFFNFDLILFLNLYGVILILTVLTSMFFLNPNFKMSNYKIDFKSFIRESVSRVIGDLSYYFLLLAPSYFLLFFTKDLVMVSAISFCQVIINSTTILIKPISFIKLTKTAQMVNENDFVGVKKDFFKVTGFTFLVFVIMSVLLIMCIDLVINLLYSKSILVFSSDIKFFLLVTPFFATYVGGRSFIDGLTHKPVMSYINLIGLLTFLLILFLYNGNSYFFVISFSFSFAFLIMDVIMFTYIKKYKKC